MEETLVLPVAKLNPQTTRVIIRKIMIKVVFCFPVGVTVKQQSGGVEFMQHFTFVDIVYHSNQRSSANKTLPTTPSCILFVYLCEMVRVCGSFPKQTTVLCKLFTVNSNDICSM